VQCSSVQSSFRFSNVQPRDRECFRDLSTAHFADVRAIIVKIPAVLS
jgi:hypothetical protein